MQHQQGDDIGVFLAVCAAGSFVSASTRLALSASAVAKAISRLEGRLGVRLFQRTTRRLNLTPEGVVYRDVCVEARQNVERVETALFRLAREPAGRLRVSLPPLFGVHVVAPALYCLCRRWPEIDLDISTSVSAVDMAAACIDLAVRIGELPDVSGMVARPLGTQRVVLCASRAYAGDRGLPQTIEDLSDHEMIAQSSNGRPRPWHFRQSDGAIVSLLPKARILLDGSLLTLSAVRAGQGIGLLPHWLVRDEIASGELVVVLGRHVAGHLPVHAVWPASPVMLPRLRVAIDAIVDVARARLSDGDVV